MLAIEENTTKFLHFSHLLASSFIDFLVFLSILYIGINLCRTLINMNQLEVYPLSSANDYIFVTIEGVREVSRRVLCSLGSLQQLTQIVRLKLLSFVNHSIFWCYLVFFPYGVKVAILHV